MRILTEHAVLQTVLASHPHWALNLKRVRKMLSKVVSTPEAPESAFNSAASTTWVEEDIEDWCLITTPAVAPPAYLLKAGTVTSHGRGR